MARLALGSTLLLLGACTDSPVAAPVAPPAAPPAAPSAQVLGLVQVTFSGIGTQAMQASVVPWGSGAHAVPGTTANGLHLDVTPVAGGDGSIELEPVSTGSFTTGARGVDGERYLYATFQVRNAQSDSTAYTTPRTNLTFLAVSTAATLNGTALSTLNLYDGSAADAAIAPTFLPTGQVYQTTSSALASAGPDVLQVLTEAEAASFAPGAPVTDVFPYGFVVRNPNTSTGRTLPANPAAGQFDGTVTFAYKLPLQATAAEDPFTVSVMFLAVDDGTTRITQSPEEQDAAAQAALEQRATELGATNVTLLSGGAYTGAIAQRTLCGARVAGPVGTPTAVVGGSCTGARGVIYVDDDAAAGGDGTTWASAYASLQDALGAATSGDSVWVAAGTYTPGSARTATFHLANDVTILGGFAGTETDPATRDPGANVTILSGDVNGDDTSGGSTAENSYHVMTASGTNASAVLDGVTIAAGNANLNNGVDNNGGGMFNSGGSPTLRNLHFAGNLAGNQGGGLYNSSGAAPTIETVTFENNSASYGGGMANNASAPSISNATFSGNEATTYGGGLADLDTSNPVLESATFTGNRSFHGGGMADIEESISTLHTVAFTGNSASANGGGMTNDGGGNGVLVDVTFTANAADYGGGLFSNGGSLKIGNVKFIGDTARMSGGGAYATGNEPVFVNVLFSGNTALAVSGGGGGGLSVSSNAVVNLVNVTFSGNTAAAPGGALNGGDNGQVIIANSILWGDTGFSGAGDEISKNTCGVNGCPSVTISYSLIQNAFSGGTWETAYGTDGGNNLGSDPRFVDANGADDIFGTMDDNPLPNGRAAASNSGSNAALPTDAVDLDHDGNTSEVIPVDLAGNPRVANTTVDRGAYERP